MLKKLTCIECPKGCVLSVKLQGSKVNQVTGNICLKGKAYAVAEIEDPRRILTTTVPAQGLSLKMVPVRTDAPIPKDAIFKALKKIKKLKITKRVCSGDIVVKNFMGSGINLIATRDCR